MNESAKIQLTLVGIAVVFLVFALGFRFELWGKTAPQPNIPLVDLKLLSTDTPRKSFVDLALARGDTSGFDCTGCHEKGQAAPLQFDRFGNVIVPSDHSNIVMNHGSHHRNNNCYNCHDETHRDLLQARDGHVITFWDSQRLCGSCHGPTLRDWEAGAHGRTSGHWNREKGPISRKVCASCHNPHSPKYEGRAPAPMPNPLRPLPIPDHGGGEDH